jgi:hypothetical protein
MNGKDEEGGHSLFQQYFAGMLTSIGAAVSQKVIHF